MEPIVVIGVGNLYRSDDGVGVIVARKLKTRNLPSVIVREETGEGSALMESWGVAEKVIIVDATSSGSPPGTIRRIDLQEQTIPSSFLHRSSHSFGVAEAVELTRVLGRSPVFLVFGIEGGNFAPGIGLSPEVNRGVDEVVLALSRECPEHEAV